MAQFDVLVIGSGPGGYVAAIRAAQLGLSAACVEKDRLGGVCLNWGCIPSKALLKSAEYAQTARHLSDYGVNVGEVTIDFPKVIKRSRGVADRSEKGVKFLFKKYGVTSISGTGRLVAAGEVEVTAADGKTERHQAKHIIVATGARSRTFPGLTPDGERILTSREAIVLDKLPASAIVLGAGAIGLEFAWFWRQMGVKVTLVEGAPQIAPVEDAELADALAKHFTKEGVQIKTGAFCEKVERVGDGTRVTLKDGGVIEADITLLALGVAANIEDLGLEQLGVATNRGFIVVDRSCRTNVPGVYAIGDVAGPPMLAHKASAEAHICVERIAGRHVPDLDRDTLPAGTYCQPQIASVGRTEAALKAAGVDYKVGRFPFAANGKSRGTGHTEGFVKVLIGAKYGEILGAHIFGYDATELLANVVMAKSGEVDAETFLHTIHNHPTAGEAVMEAVAEALGVSVHI
ncbi:MAG: dihydrolipoyl dehydrogenase [Deltaproteobacteria bacterium]|nr:dihydrolipoyl dehydrogenase [Deltaproteobacteria bacterium]